MPNTMCKTSYFEKPGPENTEETLSLAKKRAKELGIKNVIVATTSGETGAKASNIFKGFNLIIVSHVTGFKKPDHQELQPENRDIIEKNKAKILTTAHAFGAIGRAVNKKFATIQVDGIVANVLRAFGQGVKVACEISCMATDAGLIETCEDAIAVGGTMSGADTAVVLRPANTHAFFDLRIREIVCKPRL